MGLGGEGRTGALLVDRVVRIIKSERLCVKPHPTDSMFGNGSSFLITLHVRVLKSECVFQLMEIFNALSQLILSGRRVRGEYLGWRKAEGNEWGQGGAWYT